MIYQLDVYYFLIASPKQLQLQAGGDGHKLRAVVVDVLHDDGNDHLGPESAGGWPDEPEGVHLLPDHLSIVARVKCLQSELSGQVPLSDLDPGLPIVPQLPVTPTDGRHQGDGTTGGGGLIHPGQALLQLDLPLLVTRLDPVLQHLQERVSVFIWYNFLFGR